MTTPLELPALTLPQMLREQAALIPDRIAIRQKDFGIWQPCSWRQYWERSCHVGLGLEALGLPAGGHVGILSENRIEWVLGQMGAGVIGAVAVGLYPHQPRRRNRLRPAARRRVRGPLRGSGAGRQGPGMPGATPGSETHRGHRNQGPAQLRGRGPRPDRVLRRARGRGRAAVRGRPGPHRGGAGPAAAGGHRPDDLYLGLHRQAQGCHDFVPQHARRGARHHRPAGPGRR